MDAFRGLRLIATNRSLWPFCWRPLMWAFAVYVGAGVLAWVLLVPRLVDWIGARGVGVRVTGVLGSILLAVLWIFLFSYALLLLIGLFSSLLWDGLSEEVERLAGGAPEPVRLTFGARALDSLARLVLALVVGVLALGLSLFLGPIAGWLAAGVLALLDCTAPAFLRRGRALPAQLGRVIGWRGLPFVCIAGLLSLIPVANVLLLPGMVAGGTLLTRRLEGV